MKNTMGARITLLTLTVLTLTAGAARADFAPGGPAVDPFKPLIEVKAPVETVEHKVALDPVPAAKPPPTPPVPFRVHALAEDSANHVAVIELEGETFVAQPGMTLPSKENPLIEVQKVTERDVTVYDHRVNRLRKQAIVGE